MASRTCGGVSRAQGKSTRSAHEIQGPTSWVLVLVHMGVKYLPSMPGEYTHLYLFVAIASIICWTCVEILLHETAVSASSFLEPLLTKVLNDNSKKLLTV